MSDQKRQPTAAKAQFRPPPLSEATFEHPFWDDLLNWPHSEINAPLNRAGWTNCTPVVFLLAVVDRLAAVAPSDRTGNAARLWAAELILSKVIQGDLICHMRRVESWCDIGIESWKFRYRYNELDPVFARGVFQGDEKGNWYVYVERSGLDGLIERARAINGADAPPVPATIAKETAALAALKLLCRDAKKNKTPVPVKTDWFDQTDLGTNAKKRVWAKAAEEFHELSSLNKPKRKRTA